MTIIDNRYIFLNADDEEPSCINCDYCWVHIDCENSCGAKYDWKNYRRKIRIPGLTLEDLY